MKMKIKTLRRIIKIFNLLIIPLKVIFDKISSSTTFKILRILIKLYVFLFAVLGTGIMSLTGSDLTSVSVLYNEFMDNYLNIFKEWFKRFGRWLSNKIYSGDETVDVHDSSKIEKIRKEIYEDTKNEELEFKMQLEKWRNKDSIFKKGSIFKERGDWWNVEYKSTWSEYIWDTVTSPYVLIPSTVIAGVITFYYVKPDEFNAVLMSISAAISSYFFGSDSNDNPPSDDPNSSKTSGLSKDNNGNPSEEELNAIYPKGKVVMHDGVPSVWSGLEKRYMPVAEYDKMTAVLRERGIGDPSEEAIAFKARMDADRNSINTPLYPREVVERVNNVNSYSDVDSESSKKDANISSTIEEVGKAIINFPWSNSEDGDGVGQRSSESSSSDNTPKSNTSNLPPVNSSNAVLVARSSDINSSDDEKPQEYIKRSEEEYNKTKGRKQFSLKNLVDLTNK